MDDKLVRIRQFYDGGDVPNYLVKWVSPKGLQIHNSVFCSGGYNPPWRNLAETLSQIKKEFEGNQ